MDLARRRLLISIISSNLLPLLLTINNTIMSSLLISKLNMDRLVIAIILTKAIITTQIIDSK